MKAAVRNTLLTGCLCFLAGLSVASCTPDAGSRSESLPPGKSIAALNYASRARKEDAQSDFLKLIQNQNEVSDAGYYRNVECAAALQGALENAQQHVSRIDPSIVAFRQAIELFRERAVATGEKAGYSRRRVLSEIARAHRADSERDQDAIQRQAQQSVLCLYQLS